MEPQVEMLETSRYYCQTDIAKTRIARQKMSYMLHFTEM